MTASLPDAVANALSGHPALAMGLGQAVLLDGEGELHHLSATEARHLVRQGPRPLVVHGRETARRLGHKALAALDLLELFCFVRPAQFCVPTPRGLAEALDLPPPASLEDAAAQLPVIAATLLGQLVPDERETTAIAWALARAQWSWGPAVLSALGAGTQEPHSGALLHALQVWRRLPEWNEHAPPPPPGHLPVSPDEARQALAQLLDQEAENRPQQADYAAGVTAAFVPREQAGEPHLVLAEAGTGVGKTLGYIASGGVWADKNQGAVWISTFTRNLQRQLNGELDRRYPDVAEKALRVVVRKGRENYLCLLNLADSLNRLAVRPEETIALGLIVRWARASRDGDMVGGDFPGWLADLLGPRLINELTDTRGECLYSACDHYRKCYVERSIRRARRARIVVANHALVLAQAAMGGGDDSHLPLRYVFDEGHHLYDAADKAFSAALSGFETAELRRWLRGAEASARSRARGLKTRIEDLLSHDRDAEALDAVLNAAMALPGPGWHQRISGNAPVGPTETFLARVRQQVYARSSGRQSAYSLETETRPLAPDIADAARVLDDHLANLVEPAQVLVKALARRLDDEADELDSSLRQRIEAASRSLERRALLQVEAWRGMLQALQQQTPSHFIDWFSVERRGGHDVDVGMHRHWIDPAQPFAEAVLEPAHGVVVTSATLRDVGDSGEIGWGVAEQRCGAPHLGITAHHVGVPSPFDYGRQTRVLVVNDLNRNDPDQVAAAYRELFLAAGGGGLGLFTAISRLREVHRRIAPALNQQGLSLLAQHVDELDTGTLIDIFRAEPDSCLLGTDAVRDGVDVPGRSLRLIVFDRVPWPRPSILHKARRAAFSQTDNDGRRYDEMLTRLKLKQAFGRLIRRRDDAGVFVMLDRALPSRLALAFPEGVAVERLGLAEAIAATRQFLHPPCSDVTDSTS